MSQALPIYGVDVGTTALRVCRFEQDGVKLVLRTFDQIDLQRPKPGQRPSVSATRSALKELLERNGVQGGRCTIAVPWQHEFIDEFIAKPGQVEPDRAELVEALSEKLPGNARALFIQTAPAPKAPSNQSLVFAARRDVVKIAVRLVKGAGLQAEVVDSPSFALYNALEAFAPEALNGDQLIVDVGATSTRIISVRDGAWSGRWVLPSGGDAITTHIVDQLGLPEDIADAYKLGGSDLNKHGIIPRDVHEAIEGGCRALAEQIRDVVPPNARAPRKIHCAGRSFHLAMMRDALADTLDSSWSLLRAFDHCVFDEKDFSRTFLERSAPSAALCLGLGLRKGDEA